MRRGISETIATLLMLVIVVSLGITVLSWGNQYITTLRQGIEQQAYITRETLKERPVIEHVQINSTGAYIFVRNVGFTDCTIDTVYIERESDSNITLITVSPISLDPGDAGYILIRNVTDYTFTSGEIYIFTLVSKRGFRTSYTELVG